MRVDRYSEPEHTGQIPVECERGQSAARADRPTVTPTLRLADAARDRTLADRIRGAVAGFKFHWPW